jgi:hypothetical protein
MRTIIAGLFFGAVMLGQTGIVRSAGIPIPGATVTAVQGDRKLTTVTGEDGRYVFEGMTAGEWQVEIETFGFVKASKPITIAATRVNTEWTLELMAAPAAGLAARRAAAARNGDFQQVQNVAETQVTAELARSAAAAPELPAGDDSTESFLLNGSLSRGLQVENNGPEFPGPGGDPRFGGGPPGMTGEGAGGDGQIPGRPGAGGGPGGGFGGGAGGGGRGGFGGGPGGGFGGPGGGGPGRGAGQIPAERLEAMRRRAGQQGRRGGPDTGFIGNRARRGQQNQVRGAAFFTLRNSALDASPYSLNGQAAEKPSYSQSRFGFMIGGPLMIPKLLSSPNTFLFINYNGARSRNPYRGVGTVPTLPERAGDFSERPVILYDPTTRTPYAGNRIPLSQINPVALGLLNFFPAPNQPGLVQNFVFTGSNRADTDALNVRVNRTLNRKNRLNGTFNTQRRDGTGLQLFGFRDTTSGSGMNTDASWAYTIAPRSIHNLRFSFNRNTNDTLPFFAFGADVAGALGIAGASRDPINYGPPNLTFTNYGALSDANPVNVRNKSYTIGDSMTWSRGNHNASFGFEFRHIHLTTRTDQNARGTFSFSGLATSGFDGSGLALANTGYDFADFLLGRPQSSSIRFGDSRTSFIGRVYSAFGQDDWRLRSNFSLTLGLRYEYFTPMKEEFGRIANLAIAPGFTGVTVITPETPGTPAALIQPDKNNFSPRIGYAWKPSARSRTQVRGGYGIYYNSSIYQQIASRMAAQPPFANTSSVTTSAQTPLTLAAGFTQIPVGKTVLNTYAVDLDYALSYAQTWSTSVQRELPRGVVVEVGYLGTKGTRLDIQRQPNRAAPGSPLTAEQRRQIGNAVGFTYESSEGNSIYHAMQVRATRRMRGSAMGSVLYTWGKSIDNSSTFGGAGNTVAQDDRNLAAERGLSSFDQRHTVRVNFVLGSPVGARSSDTPFHRLVKDWTLNGGVTYSSGTPLTARVLGNRADSSGTGAVGAGRADATGLSAAGGEFFNLAAFAIPQSGRFGNAGRNTIRGPAQFGLNASFGRSFNMGERRRLEFRVESNNMTKRVSITNVGTVVNSLTYGLPLAAAQMRNVQATLRFRF